MKSSHFAGVLLRTAAFALLGALVLLSFGGCFVTDFLFERPGVTTSSGDNTASPDSETEYAPSDTNTVPTGEISSGETTSEIVIIPYTTGPETTADPEAPLYPDYLTGLSFTTDYSKVRPAAIVIDNLSTAVPQNGLERADILIECQVEGGITRLVLITNKYSSNEVYGPIRSTRDYIVSLSQAFGALMVGGGFSPSAGQMIAENSFDYIDGVHDKYALSGFFRDITRYYATGYEHSLMITGQGIKALAGINNFAVGGNYTEPVFNFGSEPSATTYQPVVAEHIVVNYSDVQKVQFVYSRSGNVYYRYQLGNRPHLDADSGEQLNFDSVLVLFADHQKIIGDDAGRISVGTVGTGTGYYASGGFASPILWSRETDVSPLAITYADGSPVTFTPGRTMISIFPAEYKDNVSRFNINQISQ